MSAAVAAAAGNMGEGLAVSEISIQRPKGSRGSQLVYATGSLTNGTTRQRLGVKIEMNLLNLKGEEVDQTSDYRAALGPGEVWKFRAMVHNVAAASGKVAQIREDQ